MPRPHHVDGVPHPVERVRLASGRSLAFELVGAGPGDAVVLVLHGTPDSRLATPPDPLVPSVPQILVDRPGFGDSDVDPDATPSSVADDLAEACGLLGFERIGVMAWSAGALFALALAARHPSLVGRLVLAAPLAPAGSWAETAPDRFHFEPADIVDIAPLLVPEGIDLEAAVQIVLGDESAARQREILSIPGAAERLGRALMGSVQSGLVGLQRDLAAQLVMPDLASVAAPCHIVVGAEDATCPPAMGQWLAGRMTHSATTLQRVAGAGHAFPLIRWKELVKAAAEAG
jgi:pimeloyl-ACP methyl ester carboxylesterase